MADEDDDMNYKCPPIGKLNYVGGAAVVDITADLIERRPFIIYLFDCNTETQINIEQLSDIQDSYEDITLIAVTNCNSPAELTNFAKKNDKKICYRLSLDMHKKALRALLDKFPNDDIPNAWVFGDSGNLLYSGPPTNFNFHGSINTALKNYHLSYSLLAEKDLKKRIGRIPHTASQIVVHLRKAFMQLRHLPRIITTGLITYSIYYVVSTLGGISAGYLGETHFLGLFAPKIQQKIDLEI